MMGLSHCGFPRVFFSRKDQAFTVWGWYGSFFCIKDCQTNISKSKSLAFICLYFHLNFSYDFMWRWVHCISSYSSIETGKRWLFFCYKTVVFNNSVLKCLAGLLDDVEPSDAHFARFSHFKAFWSRVRSSPNIPHVCVGTWYTKGKRFNHNRFPKENSKKRCWPIRAANDKK